MDAQAQEYQPLTFSYPSRATSACLMSIGLDTLELRHPAVKEFLSSNVFTNGSIAIQQIKFSDSAACIYMLENASNIKLILKILPRNSDPLTEIALTRVSSDIFVSPKLIGFYHNFILLPYIGRGHPLGAFPFLFSQQSFARILTRLGLLHGASIIPQKIAQTNLDRLRLPASRELTEKHLALKNCFQSIEEAFSALGVTASAKPVFIHADITSSNIVESVTESYLIDWGHAGQGNPYFDLGAVFAMYALEDGLKLRLIREYYPNTVSNKLPEDDKELLKVLNLFSAIYWLKIVIFTSQSSNHSNIDFVQKVESQKINVLLPLSQIELASSALCEAEKRIEMVGKLNSSNKYSL